MPEQQNKCNIPHLNISLESIFSKMIRTNENVFIGPAREMRDECSLFINVEVICFACLQQESYEMNPFAIFARICTVRCIARCNPDDSLEEDYYIPFFKLIFLIPTLSQIFYLPKPSDIYKECGFRSFVSGES